MDAQYWVILVCTIKALSITRSGARTPDVKDPCANADTQRHFGDIAYLPTLKALSGHSGEESENEEDRAKRGATSISNLLWPGGIVHYSVSSLFSELEREKIYEAMRHWENHTCVRFQVRRNQVNYINIIKSSGCCSYVGNLRLGEQGLSLGRNCIHFPIIVHEIGHVLGFWHEHTRPDRDDYIDVFYGNIRPNYLKNFEKQDVDMTDDLGVGYDYNSIMHYNYDYFARYSGLTTLNSKASGIPLGLAVRLSPSDILQTNLLYNCDDSEPPNSTLPPPPPSPLPSLPYLCGSILSSPTGSFSHSSNGTHLNGTDCAWLILPKGRFLITLELQNIFFNNSNNCKTTHIEVYQGTNGNGRLMARICSSFRSFQRLIMHDNSFVRLHSDRNSGVTGFTASYRITDVNECSGLAKCSHNCRNTNGGYECYCRRGYYLSGDGRTCFDINECGVHNGGCSEVCNNNGGSYYCSCSTSGYILYSDLKTCRRRGPTCSISNGHCDHKCTEQPTQRVCSCHSGYELQSDGQSCYDINECRYGIANCQWRCVNTRGSFFCQCPAEFHLASDNRTCAPDRVCHVKNGGCNQRCRSLGANRGASCYCLRGYRLRADGVTCEDIDECDERRNICHHTCINTNGSYVCECREGYELSHNKKSCTNINECQTGTHKCDFSDFCYDIPGSYTCSCPRGYRVAPDGRRCLDVDECERGYSYYCTHSCVNTPGSYTCVCREGYVLQSGWYCFDVNECLTSSHRCDHTSGAYCRNTEGGYTCACLSGFRREGNWSCVDIDECQEITNVCGSQRYCINRVGHYTCSSTPPLTTKPVITQTTPTALPAATTPTQVVSTHSDDVDVTTSTPSLQTTDFTSGLQERFTTEVNTPEKQHRMVTEAQAATEDGVVSVELPTSSISPTISTIEVEEVYNNSTHAVTSHHTSESPTVPGGCGGLLSDYSGTIATENWPETYPVNVDCEWTIRLPAKNQILQLSFKTLAYGIAGNMPKCSKDWIQIISRGSNTTWGPFCGFTIPSNISVQTDEVTIRFHSGPKHGSARKGFSIQYLVWDTCRRLPPPLITEGRFVCNAVIGPNNKFGPPDFPGFLTPRTRRQCLWVIITNQRAKLRFLYFDLPKSDGCKDSNVKLYNDYYRHQISLVATLCGNVSREFDITTSYYSVELNVGSSYGDHRGIHAIVYT